MTAWQCGLKAGSCSVLSEARFQPSSMIKRRLDTPAPALSEKKQSLGAQPPPLQPGKTRGLSISEFRGARARGPPGGTHLRRRSF